MEFNTNFILGCSAIGAGLAVIAGIGPGVAFDFVLPLLEHFPYRIK